MSNDNSETTWRPHALVSLVLLAELCLWWANHRTSDELRAAAAAGPARERVEATFILANRDDCAPELFDRNGLVALLRDPQDPLLSEFARSTNLCKFEFSKPQLRDLVRISGKFGDPLWWRAWFIQLRKVGGIPVGAGTYLQRREFEWYLEAMAGHELPADAVRTHVAQELALIRESAKPKRPKNKVAKPGAGASPQEK
ncbi:MAG: hypothetical protein QF724_02820 [Planctomycetota bacterium]|jgi:hypothetical protein|nr:hypothetical protein [Planctomycetota bacterium]MDP6370727.1 hypothetical protein [Planctomycetota bacterium]MDP6518296.1 hypothetical protein [Planctomycetota bacterium]MDP6837842.1 hypothetical protein [Planctomycetota bacterium]